MIGYSCDLDDGTERINTMKVRINMDKNSFINSFDKFLGWILVQLRNNFFLNEKGNDDEERDLEMEIYK